MRQLEGYKNNLDNHK